MKKIITIIAVACSTILFAQDFQGVATYKSHRKMNIKENDKKNNSKLHKELLAQLKKQYQQEYTLTFSQEESIYKREETLSTPVPSSSGITIKPSGLSDVLYKNIKENRYIKATTIHGKPFLIKDSIQVKKWELVNETKKIGDYTCNKAIFKETYKTQTITDDGGIETIEKERVTVAWYTMQIPVNIGPSDYYGLPGLILEINDGDLVLICSRIVINPKDKIKIKEPRKGKEVTQKEFDEISKKKNEEMRELFKSSRKRGSGSTVIFGG